MKTYFSMSSFRYTNKQLMGERMIRERSFLLIRLDVCYELRVNKNQK